MPCDDISGNEGDGRMTGASSPFFFLEREPNPSTIVGKLECEFETRNESLSWILVKQNRWAFQSRRW